MTRHQRPIRAGVGVRTRREPSLSAPSRLSTHRRLRIGLFAVVVLVLGGAAIALVAGRLATPNGSDLSATKMVASMSGFSPKTLTARTGETVRIDLIDRDTSMHSDGGGVHSFHIDALNVHQKVQPETDLVFSFAAPTTPGTYDFYCDTCCGGKENPSMHGVLTVTA